jgi:hypothetical protein
METAGVAVTSPQVINDAASRYSNGLRIATQ